jgi:hypothetical protein
MKLSAILLCQSQALVATVAIVLAIAGVARSQESSTGTQDRKVMPEYVQEFFMSEAVRCQEKGEFQLTFSTSTRQRVGRTTGLQVEYGLTDTLQLNLELPGTNFRSDYAPAHRQWSSVNAGFLYSFRRNEHPFALSAAMMFEFPVQPNERLSYEPGILFAKIFRKIQVHASLFSEIAETKPSLDYNIASVYSIKHRWFPTFEFNGRRRGTENVFYLTPGLYRHHGERVEIGAGVPIALGGVAAPFGVVAKMNWEFGGIQKN